MRESNGFVLITVLFISVIVGLLVLGTSFTALVDRRVASSQRVGTEAFYVAQAGVERMKTGLFFTLTGDYRAEGVNACTPDIGVELDLGGGLVLFDGGEAERVVFSSGGSAVLSFRRDGRLFILTSVGHVGPARSTVEIVATAGVGPQGVWDNAVFAEDFSGSADGSVAGNAAVYGSMHIIDGAAFLDDTAADFTGGAGVFNNYYGVREASDLMDSVAVGSLGERARDVEDLCSMVKIRQGVLDVSNNASLGNTDTMVGTRTYTGAVEGAYLDSGSELRVQGNTYSEETGSTNVHLRSGVQSYEDNNLDVPFPEPNEGRAPLRVDLIENPDCGWLVYDDAVHLPPRVAQNRLDEEDRVCSSEEDADGGSSSISWNAETEVLTIDGDIVIDDYDVVIGDIATKSLTYGGFGTVRSGAERTVTIRNDVRTADGADGCDYLGGKDHGCAVGIVAEGPLVVRTNGVIDLLMYSDETVQIAQGSAGVAIVGAIVGRNVVTANVPKILTHPDVARVAALIGMPGSEPGNEGFVRDISMARR